jgi:hypothetical protein
MLSATLLLLLFLQCALPPAKAMAPAWAQTHVIVVTQATLESAARSLVSFAGTFMSISTSCLDETVAEQSTNVAEAMHL